MRKTNNFTTPNYLPVQGMLATLHRQVFGPYPDQKWYSIDYIVHTVLKSSYRVLNMGISIWVLAICGSRSMQNLQRI